MTGRSRLKLFFYLNLLVVLLLVAYKVYLNFFEQDFESVHSTQIERIQQSLAGRDHFRFAVVGNINNSIGIFERKIIPMLNAAKVEFVISAGNAVSNGGEDKYRALHRTLDDLEIPYLLTFGAHEYSNFGSFRFYEHYGPHFFAFHAGNSRFLFLDSTGKTPYAWQLRWLEDELTHLPGDQTFLFMGHPLYRVEPESLFDGDDQYLENAVFRARLKDLIERHAIRAVFSANLSVYAQQTIGGTEFITTGGAGGLVLNNDASFYHFVTVEVDGDRVDIDVERLDIGQHRLFKTLESLWFFLHSLFYVGYLNFILLVCALAIVAIKLYTLLFVDRDYYPNFDLDPTPFLNKPLRVAMFTNNYLPFIGGVPISIDRLRRGLKALGHPVFVVAPRYRKVPEREEDVLRVPALLTFGEKKEFRLANIFLPRIRRRLKSFRPDIIHLHHPFWLCRLGLWLARRLNVPTVYTYHTRLEHYAHFVPLPGAIFRNLISHYLIKHFANKCDGVIVPTYSAEEYLRIIGVRSPIFVQATGIDFDRFQHRDAARNAALRQKLGIGEEPVCVSVSRLSREKNIDFMIEAAHGLRKRLGRSFRFLMIGDGDDRNRLQRRIDALGLNDTVILTGSVPQDEIAAYYQLGDLFLFASKSETQGMVILEAMAAGVPVVAVRSSGIDDVIQEGFNGFKTPEQHPDQWIGKALLLLGDDRLRKAMGENAMGFARRFAVDRVAAEVVGIYAQTLAARRQAAAKTRSPPR